MSSTALRDLLCLARAPEPGADNLDAVRAHLIAAYEEVRHLTDALRGPLSAEDQQVQSMADASPAKWHAAHTTWFFEAFILAEHARGYTPLSSDYHFLFNSYYNTLGPQHHRPSRGLITRPGLGEIAAYRAHVDEAMLTLMREAGADLLETLLPLVILGLNHEQQHQELLCTDIKHALFQNPCFPSPFSGALAEGGEAPALDWIAFEGGVREVGHRPRAGVHPDLAFAYDNELPRHEVLIGDFRLASRAATNGDFLAFIEDGGYRSHALWLSDGWVFLADNAITHPLYWVRRDDEWWEYTLHGLRPLDVKRPVTHLSFFEAEAFAAWAGKRLPLEHELEIAAAMMPAEGTFLSGPTDVHPRAAAPSDGLSQIYGDVWEWTRSAYGPYPGFKARDGAIGEYNGKFMCSQFVLKGGSCATPQGHIRSSYRNFFYPHQRWQFSGVRLAEDG